MKFGTKIIKKNKNNLTFLLAALLAACLLAPAALTARAAGDSAGTDSLMSDHKIIELTDKYLALLSTIYPEDAARAGMQGYQSNLDPRDKQSETTKKDTILALRETLAKINYKKLSPSKEIAYQALMELVNKKVFDIEVLNRLQKDPSWYLESVDGIYDILLKDYKPFQERLVDAMKRAQALPAVLARGKENLENPPDLNIRLALEKAGNAYASFANINVLMNRMAQDDYTKDQIKAVCNDAKKALKDYYDFLKNLSEEDKPYVDFRLGSDNFAKLLKNVYGLDTPVKKISAALEKEIEETKAALTAALTPIIEPALSPEEKEKRTNKKGIIEIWPSDYYFADAAYVKGPKYKEVLNAFLSYYNESADYFAQHDIFAPASLKILIAPSPKYLDKKGENSVYLPPFPLLTRQFGDLLVALPDTQKEAAPVLPKLFTYAKIKLGAVAKLSAGENMLYGAAQEYTERLLKISADPFYINGWIKYSVNLAKEKGYLSHDEDLIHVAWYNYKTALFALAELKMHNGDFNYTQSLEYLTAAGINNEEAAAALDAAAAAPCTYISAVLGEQEFNRLRVKYQKKGGAKFKLSDFHQKLLSTGRVPLPVIERALQQAYERKQVESFFNTLYF
ncbi:MAG: DUF885 domain-containing protein [Elusimicrobiota bacterium]|jgi:hypothetical protein|nr:DUF885 domain-containing protein [Elusimicrobiota bacterium]